MAESLKLALFSPQPHDELYLRPALEAAGHISVLAGYGTAGNDSTVLQGCHGVISFVGDTLNAPTLEHLYSLGIRLVAQRAAGVDNIYLDAARKLGICVTHVPAYSPESDADTNPCVKSATA